MLKCHICQVLNEDDARFCLECGQRFVKATNNNLPAFPVENTSVSPNNPTENANQPKSLWTQEDFDNDDNLKNQKIDFTKESTYNENLNKLDQHFQAKDNMNNFNNSNDDNLTNPKSSKIKLHSPLLGNDDDDDDYPNMPNTRTNFSGKQKLHSPLLGNDDDDDYPNIPNNKTNFSGKQKLHSPLLGNDDNDDYPNKSNNKTNFSGKQKLHSPLLGNDDEDDYQNAANNKTNFSGKQKLHSPLLGNDDDDYQNASNNKTNFSGKQKLHSPLLGNDDDDYQNVSNNKTNFSGKQKLHSPLLGNDDDDYQNVSNNKTNFSGKQKLHSPLLGNDDNDDYAYSGQRNNLNNKSKLNSPLLRNNNAENAYEDEPVFEEINDPNVLRSPLLLSKIHTNETKQTSTNLNKVNSQNNLDLGKIQTPKPQIDNYNAGQLNPEIINSSKPGNTGTSDRISTAQTNPQITRPGFSEPEYNTKLIKPDSSPKTNINLPLSSASGKTSQTLPSANLSQIANEVEAEIDNSKNYRSRTTKPPKIDNYPDKTTNQSLKINRTLFVMIFIALLAKLGYIILTFIQQPASLNTLFIINEFAQLLLFSSCLMAINTLSK